MINNGGNLYTAYPALALTSLQSIITLVLHVCVHLCNGQATYYTIGAHNHRLVTYTFNYQAPNCTSTLLGGKRQEILHAVPTFIPWWPNLIGIRTHGHWPGFRSLKRSATTSPYVLVLDFWRYVYLLLV